MLLFGHSVVSNCLPTPWTTARLPCPSPSPRVCSNVSIESVVSFNRLILCHPLLLLPSIFPSIKVFPNNQLFASGSQSIGSISPSSECSGLISFRIDWFDLLAVPRILKSLLRTTVQKHQFFGAQLSLWSNSDMRLSQLKVSHSKMMLCCLF